MRILVLSKDCSGLGIAHQIVKEGHEVDFFAAQSGSAWSGQGIVNRVHSWRPCVARADLVICDSGGFGLQGQLIRKMKKPVLACDLAMDAIGQDKGKEEKLLEKLGIDTPESLRVENADEAKKLVEAWQEPGYIIRAIGARLPGGPHIALNKASFEYVLARLGRGLPLIIQRLVSGVEVSTEGWWNGRGWIDPFTHSFSTRRLFSGGLGPITSGMGNVVIAARRRNKLIKGTVEKLEPFLKKTSYRGPISLNTIVCEKTALVTKVTSGFSYDAIEAMMEGLSEPVADVLFETAMSIKKRFEITEEYMIAVRLSVPPWPSKSLGEAGRGLPIEGIGEKNIKHMVLLDVYKDGEKYMGAAGSGVVLKSTARGANIREAQRRAYRTLDRIQIAGKQFRLDIGDRVHDDITKLKDWGYL